VRKETDRFSLFVPGKSKLKEKEKTHNAITCEGVLLSRKRPGWFSIRSQSRILSFYFFYHLVYGSSPWQHVNSALVPQSNKITISDIYLHHSSSMGTFFSCVGIFTIETGCLVKRIVTGWLER